MKLEMEIEMEMEMENEGAEDVVRLTNEACRRVKSDAMGLRDAVGGQCALLCCIHVACSS